MEYTLLREKRKTLMMKLLPDGTLLVKAPVHLSGAAVQQFVDKHRLWAERQRAAVLLRQERLDGFRYLDGQTVPFLGKLLPIATGPAAVQPDRILLPEENRPAALAALYKWQAQQFLTQRTAFFAQRYGFVYAAVSIGSAKTLWGTCDKANRIRYSFRVMALPPEQADYIVVHELCHTLYKNHGPAFWQAVVAILPDWKQRRERCRQWGREILF